MNKNVITLYNTKRFTDQCFDKDNDYGEDDGIGIIVIYYRFTPRRRISRPYI